MDASEVFEIFETLLKDVGGWAVVLLLGRWMLVRFDRALDQNALAVKSFSEFEAEEKETHTAIMGALERITRTQQEQTITLHKLWERTLTDSGRHRPVKP